MELRQIKLEDKGLFEEFMNAVKEPLADTSFTMRLIWAEQLRHTWAIINGNLCVFGFLKDRHVVWGPIINREGSATALKDTLERCFAVVDELNRSEGINYAPKIIYIPEYLKEQYEQLPGFSLSEWSQDYVYNTKDLLELPGKEYHSKRRELNIFCRNKSIKSEPYSFSSHSQKCIELVERWKKGKEGSITGQWDSYALTTEAEVAKRLILLSNHLDVRGAVVKSDEKVVGLALGEALGGSMASKIIQKTDFSYRGASEFVFREFARQWKEKQYIDAQDDFGVEYLRKMKLAYHPTKLIKCYALEKSG